MPPKNRILRFFFTIALILFVCSSSFAQGDFRFSAELKESNEKQIQVSISAIIGLDHLLYKNQLSFEINGLEPSVTWPKIKVKKDPFSEDMIEVFAEGTHDFLLTLNKPIKDKIIKVRMNYQGCTSQTCFMPTFKEFEFSTSVRNEMLTKPLSAGGAKKISVATSTNSVTSQEKSPSVPIQTPSGFVDFSSTLAEKGTLWVLILALLGGLLVSLTPCVYPMIPITLSIIGGRKENTTFAKGLALSGTYVAGLSLTYAILGLAAASFGAQIRGFLQGTAFQVIISLTFFVLAFSMFDVFMIQAPNSVRNKLGNIKTSGMLGIFFMGMVSGLMASPCVAAPLAGILAFIASTGSKFLGFFMLMFFAWGMSFPLLLIGAFSGSLNSLPKAGEWMIRVKEFYGFLLLGASLFFIQPLIGPSWTDILMSLLLAAFAAYLGLFTQIENGAPLLPRVMKSFGVVAIAVSCAFAISATSKWGGLCMTQPSEIQAAHSNTKMFWHTKLEDAIKEAKKSNKPIFVDFRAEWCSICKELERDVFPDPKISVLFEKMVLLKIDTTNLTPEIEKLIKEFQVIGLPTLITLDSSGKELPALRMVGEVSVEHLEKNLRQAL